MNRALLAGFLLAACSTDDPTQLSSPAPLGHRSGDTPAVTADGTTDAEKCFNVINKYRAELGLDPYERWTSSETCASGEAESDAKSGKGHGSFPRCGEFAQNECPGYPGTVDENLPECLADMWAEGKGGGHYENMSSTKYTQAACGIYTLADGSFWAVQNFK